MKKIKKILCCLGWHSFRYEIVEEDGLYGISNKYKCKWCGKIGMLDSHGNLF